MTAVPTMTENVEKRTGEEEQEREIPVEVRPVLGHEEEADDGQESKKSDMEAAHTSVVER